MQFNNPSRPAKSIFLTREKSTITHGLSIERLLFNSRPSFRASFPPKLSGNLIMIADAVSINTPLGSAEFVDDRRGFCGTDQAPVVDSDFNITIQMKQPVMSNNGAANV